MHDDPRLADRRPNFAQRAARLLDLKKHDLRPGYAYELRIRHDDWCQHWDGGACDCDPECELAEVGTPERN